MCGVLSVVAELSRLERWGAIFAIVAGIVAVLLFVGGIVRWLFDLYERPKLQIEVADGEPFDKNIGRGDEYVKNVVASKHDGSSLHLALGKIIRVRETKGRRSAQNVALRVTNVDPPHPDFQDCLLGWTGGQEEATIQPHHYQEAYVQRVFAFNFESGDQVGCFATPPILEAGECVDFDLEVLVGGRKHKKFPMRIENPWPDEVIAYAKTNAGQWPDPFPFPSVKKR